MFILLPPIVFGSDYISYLWQVRSHRCLNLGYRTVFLCTDSNDVVNAIKPFFKSLVSRRIWRPESGAGVDLDHAYKHTDGGVSVAADAIIDMQLLAKCDVVFMTRWTKFASHVPYIMERPGAIFFDHEETAQI